MNDLRLKLARQDAVDALRALDAAAALAADPVALRRRQAELATAFRAIANELDDSGRLTA